MQHRIQEEFTVFDEDPQRAALVVNTHARTGADAFSAAADRLTELGVPLTSTYPLDDPARLPETVSGAVDAGHDLIIVGGGDGTVSSVVDMLAHREVRLGLLPLGTANDFARTLHIPTDVDGACRTIASGKTVDIDLGLCGSNYYINRASVGIGAQVARAMSPSLKKRVGPLAYPVATVKAMVHHQPFSATVTFPDGEHKAQQYSKLLQVAVANGRFYGGGQLPDDDAGIDDNTLDVSVLRQGPLREMVAVARNLKRGRPDSDHADHIRTTRVRLETDPTMRINVDGELVATTPQDFAVARNALHVVVPQTWVDGG